MTALIIWHEIWVRDSNTLIETILAVKNEASVSYLAIAVGTAVFVDVLMFGKAVFRNAKWVIILVSEIFKDALERTKQRYEERQKREAERRKETEQA